MKSARVLAHSVVTELLAHLGLGTFSSGNGVQVESGDFCSLKRPVKVLATSAMS